MRRNRAARERLVAGERRVLNGGRRVGVGKDRAAEVGRRIVRERTAVDGQIAAVGNRAAKTRAEVFAVFRRLAPERQVVGEVDVLEMQFAATVILL